MTLEEISAAIKAENKPAKVYLEIKGEKVLFEMFATRLFKCDTRIMMTLEGVVKDNES